MVCRSKYFYCGENRYLLPTEIYKLFKHSRAALPFYNLAGLTAAHGYNPLAPPTPLSNGNYSAIYAH